ncbi:hypothetical protein GUJ93_ZPchr0002g25569 [Zizania palustris]|uniref:Uncharacterized protein n=1 Tax=Zizania palustris TaxID=103762 RepID=A0A8J5V4V4_ZIZPA|nr:hypothetical protein GUJ93_ZPchr0002g25569 [Zizania palustris]
MPVGSPRRQPMSSSADSGGTPSPSSSPTLSLCCGDDVEEGCSASPERSSCCGCWFRRPDPWAKMRRSRFRRRPRTPPPRLGEALTVPSPAASTSECRVLVAADRPRQGARRRLAGADRRVGVTADEAASSEQKTQLAGK